MLINFLNQINLLIIKKIFTMELIVLLKIKKILNLEDIIQRQVEIILQIYNKMILIHYICRFKITLVEKNIIGQHNNLYKHKVKEQH